jgi:tetratricopeptide (TPR) repeat protein
LYTVKVRLEKREETTNHIYRSRIEKEMNWKGLLLMGVVIPHLMMVPTQEKITITQFDQYYVLLPSGNLKATWDITILPEGIVKSMILHAFFSKIAYVNDVVVSDAEGSLNSRMIDREGVPLMEITFRERLVQGEEYHFTCNLDVWKAVDIGETEGSFTLLTGYNFPIEKLNVTTELPAGTKLRNYFPADGKVTSGEKSSIFWSMGSVPAGYNIQISVSFDMLSQAFADGLFADGVNLYALHDFDNATEKFQQAGEIYQLLDLYEKVTECSVYLDRIEGMKIGLPKFEEALTQYQSKDYAQALSTFTEVESVYELHQIPTDDVDSYIEKCNIYLEAYSELDQGDEQAEAGNSTEALNHYEKARELFSQLGDTLMVTQIDSMTQQITQATPQPTTAPPEGRRGGGLVLVGLVAVIAIVGVLYVMKRKKPVPLGTEDEIREEMRQLKAQFVYGEINKAEYEEQLASLEEQLTQFK